MELWAIIVCSVVGGSLLLVFLIYTIIFFRQFRRNDDKPFDEIDLHGTHYEPYIDKINAAIKRVRGEERYPLTMDARDGKKLYAEYFYMGRPRTAILVHGFHSTPYNNFAYLTGELLDRGYNVLYVNQRGHLKSEGSLIRMGQKEQYDILDWIELVAKDGVVNDILVYGTSMGATTVGYLSDKVKNPKVKLLCMDCGFTSFYEQLAAIFKRPIDKLLGIGLPTFWLWGMITGIHLFKSTVRAVKKTNLPMAFIHGEADFAVPIEHTLKNYEACPTDKVLITVKEAGHTSTLLVGGQEKIDEFFEFVDKYIER